MVSLESLESWASVYVDDGSYPGLEALITDFWSTSDGITYPLAGHFVGYLVEEWGLDTVKRLYVSEDVSAAFEVELGLTVSELEVLWLESIP